MPVDVADIEARIEDAIQDAEATVARPRSYDENYEDSHFRAVVVSPAFEGKSLVQQHQLVYDALGDAMTTDVHALEVRTFTPDRRDEYETEARATREDGARS